MNEGPGRLLFEEVEGAFPLVEPYVAVLDGEVKEHL